MFRPLISSRVGHLDKRALLTSVSMALVNFVGDKVESFGRVSAEKAHCHVELAALNCWEVDPILSRQCDSDHRSHSDLTLASICHRAHERCRASLCLQSCHLRHRRRPARQLDRGQDDHHSWQWFVPYRRQHLARRHLDPKFLIEFEDDEPQPMSRDSTGDCRRHWRGRKRECRE